MARTTHGMLVRGMGRRLLRFVAIASLVLAFGAGAAPQSANPPPAQTQGTSPQFQINVQRNLVVVAVVVRDSKGQAVGDLHKEDFRLSDNGQPQEITSFAVEVSKRQPVAPQAQAAPAAPATTGAVASQPPAAALPQRFIALFFDDLHATVDDYRRTRDAAWRFLTTVRPQDHVAIFTASGKNQVDFTGDQKKLHDALFRLKPLAHRSGDCPEIDEFEAYLVEIQRSSDALAVVHDEALQCTCGAGGGEEGSPNPMAERPSTMQPMAGGHGGSCARAAERDAELKAKQVWSYAEMQARYSLQALENSVSRLAAMPGQRTLVLVSAGFLTETQAEKVDAIINRALQKDVVISAIYSPGLEAPAPDEEAGQTLQLPPTLEATKNTLKNTSSAYFTSVLAGLSSGTGGVFFYNNNDFDEGFRRAAAVPEVLYVLTFSPPELTLNGKFHTLKVTLNTHEHFTVQARRGYFASPTSLVAEAELTRVISPAAALSPTKPGLVPSPDNMSKPLVPTRVEPMSPPQTFVEFTPDELAKRVHELKNLTPADSQAMLPMILARVGATVEDFLSSFPNTACSERITTEVNNTAIRSPDVHATQAKAPIQHDAKFNYVALAKPGHKEPPLMEYRTDTKGGPVQLHGAIVTSGFVSLIAHFRLAYQGESRFRYLGRGLVKNQSTYVVAFAQRPGVARQAEQVRLRDKTGYVFLQGVAWIDPVSFAILRLRTEILQPDLDLGLRKETTEVEYSEVAFKRDGKRLWLPREVTVSGQLKRFAFSNQHHYSQYRLFIVEADENGIKP